MKFVKAQPIWPAGLETAMNITGGFRAQLMNVDGKLPDSCLIRITASARYRLYVNGVFVGHGPAAGPHGYYRVDEWNFNKDGYAAGQLSIVTIEVAGYNVNSFYTLDQPSFVQAEVESDGIVIAATGCGGVRNANDGVHGFEAFVLPERVQKVQRYSFQRPFMEAYRLTPGMHHWRYDEEAKPAEAVEVAVAEAKQLLPRGVSKPEFGVVSPVSVVARGSIEQRDEAVEPWRDRAISDIGPMLKGFPVDELELLPTDELGLLRTNWQDHCEPKLPWELHLEQHDAALVEFDCNRTGFIGFAFRCEVPSRIVLTFDEILTDGDVDHLRLECSNVIYLTCEPGAYDFETIEPYTLKYLKLIALEGSCTMTICTLREYANPDADQAGFSCSDESLGAIFEAARESFGQNAVDNFTDCPSRERAGWLCDSFFAARVEADLTGDTVLEHNFFENFLLPERFEHLPEGMLPMCYPADHYDGTFIPNWALWFIIQLEEFQSRGGDQQLIASLQPRVEALLHYFEGFRNEFGLLENLEGWVFIEWSKANDFVKGINFPSNMLYAGALEAAARLYGTESYYDDASMVKQMIRELSYDGSFYVDQAMEDADGVLEVTDNRTEVCQYYAAFFGIADPQEQNDWYMSLVNDFSPIRSANEPPLADISGIHPANAFIGYYLRMELLSQLGLAKQLLAEIGAFFSVMAERTGTLWEHNRTTASCNHGFASHVVRSLYRDGLGIASVDRKQQSLAIAFMDTGLAWCSGKQPTPDGPIELDWRIEGDELHYRLIVPQGYAVTIENYSGKQLVSEP
ncbi:family 78 glycoside hydrolase catalytic domain [Paenibacillus sp. OV219]|uniref:alpha-L-rhamnosidase-related protein n=1 Tax=Paenibacillus sp. OV219 TaxID=1884377 RepID=UPI0008B79C12|nr:family 78 glycoside hydrolase catalytic domain [Paenibacillus sp. OV219]SEO34607.1 alpha-L-rhamnosidase [Paenibacillus sp. OV219]